MKSSQKTNSKRFTFNLILRGIETIGFGKRKFWWLGVREVSWQGYKRLEWHPGFVAAAFHDAAYELRAAGLIPDNTSYKADKHFLILFLSEIESRVTREYRDLRRKIRSNQLRENSLSKRLILKQKLKIHLRKYYYRVQARLFYRIARIYGTLGGWPKEKEYNPVSWERMRSCLVEFWQRESPAHLFKNRGVYKKSVSVKKWQMIKSIKEVYEYDTC